MRRSHCGQVALALRTNWYLTFAVFLLAYGLIHDWYVAAHLWNPDTGDTARLRAILASSPNYSQADLQSAPENHPDKTAGET